MPLTILQCDLPTLFPTFEVPTWSSQVLFVTILGHFGFVAAQCPCGGWCSSESYDGRT
jgi:hypothetical protein